MVKIPELAEDGQNWKIYCAKFLEVTATFDCLEVLAGRPYEGEDWDGCNTLLCCMFMETVAPSIYFKIRCRTAHENFKYLMKHFHNNDPIPCANELQCTGTAAAVEMEKSPTSTNAATEQHADAKLDEDNLSTTKALTRGTQDINDRNVGCIQDPHMSSEASAQGTSTNCTEMTPVMLESALLHETQIEPQSSLPLTPRLPIEGEPSECKQEQAESVVMAGCTNRTAQLANPTETDVDINRTALLGREPAERVCRVDEGDGEHESQSRIQQTKFFCEETSQRNENATDNVPIAHGVLLEGEWTWCASGKASDPKGTENALNAAVQHADGSCEHLRLADVDGIELEACEGGTSKFTSVDKSDGDKSRKVKPAGTPNESERLVVLLIKSESTGDGDIPCVCLGRTNWCAYGIKGLGSRVDGLLGQMEVSRGQADMSKGQVDALRAQTDAPSTLNNAETDVIGHSEGVGTYLGARGTKHDPDEPDGCGNLADMSSVHTDTHSDGDELETSANVRINVRTGQIDSKPQNSPDTCKIETLKPIRRWKRVSVNNVDVYVPWDAPVEVPN